MRLVTRTDAASTVSSIIAAVTPEVPSALASAALKLSWLKVSIVPEATTTNVMAG